MIAEKAVLGTMLKENYLIGESSLSPAIFETAVHKNIYSAMDEIYKQKKHVDVITMITYKDPRDFGGANYLNELMNFVNVEKFDQHVNALFDVWREREKRNVIQIASMEDWDIEKVVNELSKLANNQVDDHTSISDSLVKVYEDPFIQKVIKNGAPTGIKKLDEITNGLQDAELIIIAARPSMGKSDVMLHLAKEAGWNGYLPLIYSLEMQEELLRDRLIASTGKFSRVKLRDTYTMLTPGQKEQWPKVIGKLSTTNIQIFDRAGQTVAEMRMKARKMINQFSHLKPIILIDYLTLIRSGEKQSFNKHQEIGDITKALKAMAKEFNCPVVVLAQLSRSLEQRADKRPMLSDLRESGSIEEDADLVIFPYRDAYYSKEDDDKSLEFIIAKHRNGPIGTIMSTYNKFTGEILNDGIS